MSVQQVLKTAPSPLKWHGGKSYMATKIVAMMPAHTHYMPEISV